MKIVHLSDLHIGRGRNFENTQTLLKGIVKKYEKKKRKPAIIITGDITDDGRREQYEMAKKLLDNEIPGDYHVFLCPGNHDFGWNGVMAKSENIERYQKYLSPDVNFPVLKSIDNCHFIGIDSMEDERDGLDRFGAEGEIGERQLCVLNYQIETIKKNSPEDKIIVYLHHHPFYYNFFLRLKDADELKEVIREKIDVLLFGHKHVEKRFNQKRSDKEQKYGIGVIITSKKSTDIEKGLLNATNGQPVLRFWEINVDKFTAVPVEVPA